MPKYRAGIARVVSRDQEGLGVRRDRVIFKNKFNWFTVGTRLFVQAHPLPLLMQEEEIKDVQKALEEDLVYLEQLQALHERNTSTGTKGDSSLSSLDSSMKKNTAVIRKLKTLSEASAQSILNDLKKVNHSKYVSEAVSAVLEAPLKIKDVKAAVEVLSALNQYPDFETLLFKALVDELTSRSDEVVVSKKRVLLRLFFGCAQAGIFSVSNVRYATLDKIFRALTTSIVEKLSPAPDCLGASLQSLALVNSFLKAGGPGLYPRVCGYKNEMRLRELAEGGNDSVAKACVEEIEKINQAKLGLWTLSEGDEQKMRMKVQAYVEGALKALDRWYKHVMQTKKSNDATIQSRGDISEKRHQEYGEMCDALDAFQKAVRTLAGTLRVMLPEYVVEQEVEVEEKGGSVKVVEPTRIFEDAEERALYMALPQLAEVVPSTLLGMVRGDRGEGGGGDGDGEQGTEREDPTEGVEEDHDEEEIRGEVEATSTSQDASSLSELIGRLPACVTMEECDAFAVQYCYVGGKKASSQKALALALSRPPHGAIQLLPFYSRIISSLSPFFPIIKEEILSILHRQFLGLKNVLDISTDTLEPRLRNACYIAELVKFGIYPPGKAFLQLRSLFDDFSRQNIDTACCLVQNCGNYLYRRPDTSERMVNMMNIMIKLKDAKNLESRHEELIAQAKATMYGLDTKVERKLRSPVHEFVRYQVYSLLISETVNEVAQNLRRIDWKEEAGYVRKKILGAVRKGKTSQLVPLARLVLELQRYDHRFGIDVIDEVVEEIFCGLDHPEIGHYHRRLSMTRFLGALAHVHMPGVDSQMIVDLMRTFMSYSSIAGGQTSVNKTTGTPAAVSNATSSTSSLGSAEVGGILEPVFRVQLIVALATEARSLYVATQRSYGKRNIREIEMDPRRQRRRMLCDLVFSQLEEFILRHNPGGGGRLASHSIDALVDGMYKDLLFQLPRRKFSSYAEAAQHAAAAMERYAREGGFAEGDHTVEGGSNGNYHNDMDIDGRDIHMADMDLDGAGAPVMEDAVDSADDDPDDDTDNSYVTDSDEDGDNGGDEETINRTAGPSEEDLLFERELAMAMGGPPSNVAAASSDGGPKILAAPPGVSRRDSKDGRTSHLAFKVVTKRGGRDDKSKRTVHIPVSSSLVERVAKKKEAEAEEKAALKRMVLASSNL